MNRNKTYNDQQTSDDGGKKSRVSNYVEGTRPNKGEQYTED